MGSGGRPSPNPVVWSAAGVCNRQDQYAILKQASPQTRCMTLKKAQGLFTFVFAGSPVDPQAGVPRTLAEMAALFGVQVPATGQSPTVATMTATIQPDGTLQ